MINGLAGSEVPASGYWRFPRASSQAIRVDLRTVLEQF